MLGIIGFSFFVMAVSAFEKLRITSAPSTIKNGWLTILVISACVATAGFSFFICSINGKCDTLKNTGSFAYVFLCLGVVLIGMCSSMISTYNSSKPTYEAPDSNNLTYVYIILVVSAIIVLGCLAGILYRIKNKK